MTSVEEIENFIKPLLLTNISFILDGKKIKTGKLMLFTVRDFFCVFTLNDMNKNKKVIYEIPYPFSLKQLKEGIEFSYTLESFCEKNTAIYSSVKKLCEKKTSKLFNKKLVIHSQIDYN